MLEAFRTGDGVDLIRESVRMVMQELIEAEATERVGADRYERTEARVTECNGARPPLVATQAGDIELRVPKLRKGSVLPGDLGAAPALRVQSIETFTPKQSRRQQPDGPDATRTSAD